MSDLTFKKLREVNASRAKEWNADTPWSPADRMVELVGELGEAANVMKKMKRIQDGMLGNNPDEYEALFWGLVDELGDVQICLDLLANELCIDLESATVKKFNKTSIKVGFKHRL